MFLQLPPSYSPRLFDDLKAFLEAWPDAARLAVEVRHPDWFDAPHHQALNQLLSEHDMARVVIDTRPIRSLDGDAVLRGSVYQTLLEARAQKPDVPVFMERTTDFLFVRYIGHPDPRLNEPLLQEWGAYLAEQLGDGAEAYVFCHSPENMAAPYLCRELHRLVASRVELPPLPWEVLRPDKPEQAQLF